MNKHSPMGTCQCYTLILEQYFLMGFFFLTFVHSFTLQVGLFVPHDGQHYPFHWKDKDILYLQLDIR